MATFPHSQLLVITAPGLVPAIAMGRAEHVTVTHRQNGRARLRPVKRTTPEGLGDQRRGADPADRETLS